MQQQETPIVVKVHDLHVMYGSFAAVKGVSFTVRQREVFGLLGPNGAGKTSTLSVVEGLQPMTQGSVEINGHSPFRSPKTRRQMGVQLQSTSFQPELTVEEIIRLYAGLYDMDMGSDMLASLLREAQLADAAKKHIGELSGGQQQRVSLLTAIMHNPAIVLLDEPTTGLDPQSRRMLWRQIESLRDTGAAIVLTTHSMEEAQAVCDRIAIIDHGVIIASGSPDELIAAYRKDARVRAVARGNVTLEDVFIGLTGSSVRE